jgi:hypothetical protein
VNELLNIDEFSDTDGDSDTLYASEIVGVIDMLNNDATGEEVFSGLILGAAVELKTSVSFVMFALTSKVTLLPLIKVGGSGIWSRAGREPFSTDGGNMTEGPMFNDPRDGD